MLYYNRVRDYKGGSIMAKILSFFNHKGGVGKTTLAYNVAWGLSEKGKRVLMVDADPQSNLTEITVGYDFFYGDTQQSFVYDSYDTDFLEQNNVHKYFLSYTNPTPGQELPPIKTFSKKENLNLLLGSIKLAELEETISLSISGITALSHVPMSVYNGLNKLSEDFDYTIIDLSPALSATNQLFLMLSDYFVVPVNPSIFSRQALENLDDIFRDWNRKLSGFELYAKKTKSLPKLLGIVCQNYRPYSRKDEEDTKSAKRFEERLENLNSHAHSLANDLNGFGMALKPEEFKEIFENSEPYRIANIPDYNQLATVSERERTPVVGLNNSILQNQPEGSLNTEYYRGKLESFQLECNNIVDGILKLK